MSADIVNLRQARKRKHRDEKARQAEANRLTHGRTKAEKNLTKTINEKSLRDLEQRRLETEADKRPPVRPASEDT